MPKNKVFFLHIPRCGGTSVWRAVRGIYGRPNVFHISTEKDRAVFDAMAPEARRAFDAIGGHAPLTVFRDALGGLDGYHSVVTVRDPIDRLVSTYNYIRAKPDHPRHETVSRQTFAGYALTQPGNQQTRFLTDGIPTVTEALAALDGFDDWAFAEDVNALVRRLAVRAGRRRWIVHRRNRSPRSFRRSEIDPDLAAALRKRNVVDIAFVEALRARPRRTAPESWWSRLIGR